MQLHTAPRSRAAALGRPAPRLLCVRPRTCCRPLAARPRPSPAAAAAAAGKAAQGDGIEFGKPQAPKELYEAIAADARAAMLAELRKGPEGMDAVVAALQLASEDDAIKTRTHIPLPVGSFSARLDGLAAECGHAMPQGAGPEQQLAHVMGFLYSTWGCKLAADMGDGAFSPYRVYMHNVLSQRCGTQASTAALLDALLKRLHDSGALGFRARVAVPADPTRLPLAAPPGGDPVPAPIAPGTDTRPAAIDTMRGAPAATADGTSTSGSSTSSSSDGSSGATHRWVTGPELVVEALDQLKRFYWSWSWPVGQESGFDACARALLSKDSRAGKVNPAVGVMQSSGRPYGNIELSLLAAERLALITATMHPNSWQHAMQARDYGVLLLHVGRAAEGRALLAQHQEWLRAGGHGAAAAAEGGALVAELLALSNTAASVSEILDPERDA